MRILTHDIAAKFNPNTKNKGLSNHYLYYVWLNMNRRCSEPTCKGYKDYGGRGISVCDEWKNDVSSFFEWSIKNGYQKGLTLDRKENDKNYSPENCRFVSRYGQQRNRRNSYTIEYKGEKRPLMEWAAVLDMNYALLYGRIKKGIPPEIAFQRFITKNKLMDKELSKQLGSSVKKILKEDGRTQRWLCGKLNESGLKISETSLSNKIAGEVETFSSEEVDLVFSILGQIVKPAG